MKTRESKIKTASWVGIYGNAVLSIAKITVGIIAGSLAVVADGIDSASDILTSIITLITAYIITKPPDIKHPYGYQRADTIATKALSFVIFFAGAQLGISTIMNLIEGEIREMPSFIAIYVTLVSIVGKLLLARYQFRIGKITESQMLIANGRNTQNDVIISLSVLLGLSFTFIFKLPVLDTITALAVSIWIMYVAFKIFMQTNIELMDGIEDTSIYNDVFKAVDQVKDAHNPHKVRIRKISNNFIIELDIEIDGSINLKEAHKISHEVEKSIKKSIPNVYEVLIHTEPCGDMDKNEKFGISNKILKK
ncbi:MAG: cation diffusion facilitator family transporter [Bacteroidales bacterium]|nr:cation diffusion facilitator family transporter [Bacteroidales bacterium]